MDKLRNAQTSEERKRVNIKKKDTMEKLRKAQTPEERKRINLQQKGAMEKLRKAQNKNKTDLERLICFQNATRYGPIFVCSGCDQKMFQSNVSKLDDNLIHKIRNIDTELYETVLANNIQ